MEYMQFETIQLSYVYLEELLSLQKVIVGKILNSDFFSDRSDEFADLLANHVVIGCRDKNGLLVSYCVLKIPLDRNNAFGYGVIGNIVSIGVHPLFRGHGLQKRMLKEIEKPALLYKLLYLFATISPKNLISLNNFESVNYKKIQEISCYNGKIRILMGKRIDGQSIDEPTIE